MEDFCYAGGLPVVMKEIAQHLHLDAITANGQTIGENIADAQNCNTEVIKPLDAPFKDKAGIAVLRGNLAPRGAVIKPSAATPALMVHKGRAVVFENIDDFHTRIDDENLDVDENCVMVLKNCGPQGLPRHGRGRQHAAAAEGAAQGHHRHGPHQRRAHERHRLRHRGAAHRARSGGRRAAGGRAQRRHDRARRAERAASTCTSATRNWQRRLADWKRAAAAARRRGYWKLYIDHVLQADQGADLDFLVGKRGAFVPKDNH